MDRVEPENLTDGKGEVVSAPVKVDLWKCTQCGRDWTGLDLSDDSDPSYGVAWMDCDHCEEEREFILRRIGHEVKDEQE